VVNAAIGAAAVAIANVIANSLLFADTSRTAPATMMGVPFEARDRVRLGIIGVGGRGTSFHGDGHI
jgi:hypothetical protein